MKQVNISEAKAQLSKHIAYVRRGGHVRIFDRDVPVADLVPIAPQATGGDDALLADMERRGVVRRGKSGPIPAELFQPGPPAEAVLDALLDERRQGR